MRIVMYRWHRRLAMLIALPVIALVLGGLMHPLMSHVWVPAVNAGPAPLPALPSAGQALSPAALLRLHQLPQVDQINLVQIDGAWFWQTVIYAERIPDSPHQESMPPLVASLRYFAADSGAEQNDGLMRHAMAMARYWLDAPVAEVSIVDRFTREYRSINRVLPVARVVMLDAADHHLYLDLIGQRLIAVDDRWRRVGLQLFARLHNWDFLGERHSPTRLLPLLTVVGAVIITLLLGAGQLAYALYCRWGRSRKIGKPRGHAYFGLAVLLTTLAFAVSGFETAWSQWSKEIHFTWRADTRAGPDSMPVDPLLYRQEASVALSQAWLDGELFWQFRDRNAQGEERIRYVSAADGQQREQADIDYAHNLLTQWLEQPVTVQEASLRTTFGMDYPAIFTRLPVVRLALDNAPLARVFVETHSGQLAHVTTSSSAARSMRFMVLHKYHLLDGLGARGRDLVMSLAAISVLLLVCSGLLLRWRRRRQ